MPMTLLDDIQTAVALVLARHNVSDRQDAVFRLLSEQLPRIVTHADDVFIADVCGIFNALPVSV